MNLWKRRKGYSAPAQPGATTETPTEAKAKARADNVRVPAAVQRRLFPLLGLCMATIVALLAFYGPAWNGMATSPLADGIVKTTLQAISSPFDMLTRGRNEDARVYAIFGLTLAEVALGVAAFRCRRRKDHKIEVGLLAAIIVIEVLRAALSQQ